MKKKLLLNNVTALILQIISIICNFVLPRLYLQFYNSDTNGLVQSISQFLGIISLCELGVGQVIQSSLYKPIAEKDYQMTSQVVASGRKFFRRIAYILGVYIIVLSIVFPRLSSISFDSDYIISLIVVMSLNYFAQYYWGIVDSLVLNADQKNYVNSIVQIGCTIMNTTLCVVLIVEGASLQIVKLISSFVHISKPVLVHIYVRKKYTIDTKIVYVGEPIKQKWNGIAQHIASYVLSGTDTIVLTLFSTLGNVSVYSIYNMIANGINLLYHSILGGLRSYFGRLWAKQDIQLMREMFEGVEIVLHLATSFLYTCTGLLIIPFVRVYTNGIIDYEYVQPVFAFFLVFSYALQGIRAPYSILIHIAGHYKETQSCYIISAVINLVVSLALVSKMELIGIAIGTALSMSFQVIWLVIYNSRNILKLSLCSFGKLCFIDILCIALSCGFVFGGIFKWLPDPENYYEWAMMAIGVALVVAVVIISMALLFYRHELKNIVCDKEQ